MKFKIGDKIKHEWLWSDCVGIVTNINKNKTINITFKTQNKNFDQGIYSEQYTLKYASKVLNLIHNHPNTDIFI
jgi:hypothetical protein